MFDEKINALIRQYIGKNEHARFSVGIIVNDTKYDFNYDHTGLTRECYDYEIGSVTKTMTAHLVMKYVCEGRLELDRQAGYYLELEGEYPTIYELLTHTSGYRFVTPVELTLGTLPFRFKRNIYENVKREQVLAALRKRKKKKTHGYAYSDFNYAVLALVVEKISNRPMGELLDQFIKKDLGMENTHLLTDACPNTDAVCKSRVVPRWKWTGDNPYLSAGGVFSNVVDMVAYMDLQLHSERDYIQRCHMVNREAGVREDGLLICPGWHAYKNGNHLWHVGHVGCYRSSIIISKNKGIGVVGMGNASGKQYDRLNYLVKMIYGYLSRNKRKL